MVAEIAEKLNWVKPSQLARVKGVNASKSQRPVARLSDDCYHVASFQLAESAHVEHHNQLSQGAAISKCHSGSRNEAEENFRHDSKFETPEEHEVKDKVITWQEEVNQDENLNGDVRGAGGEKQTKPLKSKLSKWLTPSESFKGRFLSILGEGKSGGKAVEKGGKTGVKWETGVKDKISDFESKTKEDDKNEKSMFRRTSSRSKLGENFIAKYDRKGAGEEETSVTSDSTKGKGGMKSRGVSNPNSIDVAHRPEEEKKTSSEGVDTDLERVLKFERLVTSDEGPNDVESNLGESVAMMSETLDSNVSQSDNSVEAKGSSKDVDYQSESKFGPELDSEPIFANDYGNQSSNSEAQTTSISFNEEIAQRNYEYSKKLKKATSAKSSQNGSGEWFSSSDSSSSSSSHEETQNRNSESPKKLECAGEENNVAERTSPKIDQNFDEISSVLSKPSGKIGEDGKTETNLSEMSKEGDKKKLNRHKKNVSFDESSVLDGHRKSKSLEFDDQEKTKSNERKLRNCKSLQISKIYPADGDDIPIVPPLDDEIPIASPLILSPCNSLQEIDSEIDRYLHQTNSYGQPKSVRIVKVKLPKGLGRDVDGTSRLSDEYRQRYIRGRGESRHSEETDSDGPILTRTKTMDRRRPCDIPSPLRKSVSSPASSCPRSPSFPSASLALSHSATWQSPQFSESRLTPKSWATAVRIMDRLHSAPRQEWPSSYPPSLTKQVSMPNILRKHFSEPMRGMERDIERDSPKERLKEKLREIERERQREIARVIEREREKARGRGITGRGGGGAGEGVSQHGYMYRKMVDSHKIRAVDDTENGKSRPFKLSPMEKLRGGRECVSSPRGYYSASELTSR